MGLTFASPVWLWALLALPLLALIEWRAVTRAERAARALAGTRSPNALLAQRLPRERGVGMALRLGALTALLLGAAGPQWGRETVRRQSRGSDLVFAIDASMSMDARDVAPSRLDEARREALALLDRVEGSRVGVLVFAGDAARLCPLTLDHDAVRLTLQTLSTSALSTPGTDVGRALLRALEMLPTGRREEQAIVIWTDGEDLEGQAERALARVRTAGIRVFAVGVGTPAGDVIPMLDERGVAADLKRDPDGNVVRSRLGERLLREMGSATRGGYFRASRPGGELLRLTAAMGALARAQHGAKRVERPVARFGWFGALAALLLVADQLRWRRRASERARAAGPAATLGAAAALLAALSAPRAEAQSAWAKGDAAFRAGQWARAESLYALRARRGAPAPVQVNLATARARLGRNDADRVLSRLTAQEGRAGQAAGYNLGTLHGERKDFEPALQELRRALERDPNDADARWNYEWLSREQAKQQAQSKQQPKPSPQQQQPQPQPGQQGASGQPQGQQPPQGGPQSGSPAQAPPQSRAPESSAGGAPGMTRQQAERLLGSLGELERMERQRSRAARATEEKRGKDW